MRMCIACREMKEKNSLVRIVKSASGEVSLDLTGKQNGRGCYICRDTSCIDKAIKTRALNRALKCDINNDILLEYRETLQK